MSDEENAFVVAGVMEGNQYILNRRSSIKYKDHLLEINQYVNSVKQDIKSIIVSPICRLFNTYDLVENKIVLVEEGQFIVNKMATTKYFDELEKLNNILDE
jgi:hypothetical protein